MAIQTTFLLFLALLRQATALPDPRYLNIYGQVVYGPPIEARSVPAFSPFDPNTVCTLASQHQPKLNGFDFAFCCKEDSPLLDLWLGISFQTCNISLATNQSALCPERQKFTCCTADEYTIKRSCTVPRQNVAGPPNCTYHTAPGVACANETLNDAMTEDHLGQLLQLTGNVGL